MSSSDDTEITLGTGKMLALFFGLVALCAVFFGMGFKLGKNSVVPLAATGDASPPPLARVVSVLQPINAAAEAHPSPDIAFYKSTAQQQAADAPSGTTMLRQAPATAALRRSRRDAVHGDPMAAADSGGYYVQVAAVSRQEDGAALVDALKKKQYPAFSTAGTDKLFHVEVGPSPTSKMPRISAPSLPAMGTIQS